MITLSAHSDAGEPPDFSPTAKRLSLFVGLFVVWVFALGYLQFAFLSHWALPANERVNNGDRPTFFAVHINPYCLFSEDFHLYVVRSKRILDRGWTDSPLCHTADEGRSFCAPLQAALMMLVLQTDGAPLPYALLLASILGAAWSVLYVAASRWTLPSISPLAILAAALLTIFFESIQFLFDGSSQYGQWPVHRGLRLATLAWTSPVVLAIVLATISLLFRRERPAGRICFITITVAVLSAADTWAFLFSAANICVVLGIGFVYVAYNRRRLPEGLRPWIIAAAGLTLAVVAGLCINRITGSGVPADVLTRAGFGAAWHETPRSVAGSREYIRGVRKDLRFLIVLALISAIVVRFRHRLARGIVRFQFGWQAPSLPRLYLFTLGAVPILAWIVLVGALSKVGMEIYHSSQFAWRRDYILLFAFLLFVFELSAGFVWPRIADVRRWRIAEIAGTAVLLGSLFVYHNVRIHQFITKVAAREFFLTKDEEELQDWLKQRQASLGNYTLATASHELNYLCAYWTNADLLLPEGFPYHGFRSQADLESQMARVLAVYGSNPERWQEFNLYRHASDQWSWAVSRELSARHGYMYYLLHRALMVKVAARPEPTAPRETTAFWAETLFTNGENSRDLPPREFQEGVESCDRIAALLRSRPELSVDEQPDVIIVDDVSRFLGTPDLANYTKEFQHGSLEAWVKVSSAEARRPLTLR